MTKYAPYIAPKFSTIKFAFYFSNQDLCLRGAATRKLSKLLYLAYMLARTIDWSIHYPIHENFSCSNAGKLCHAVLCDNTQMVSMDEPEIWYRSSKPTGIGTGIGRAVLKQELILVSGPDQNKIEIRIPKGGKSFMRHERTIQHGCLTTDTCDMSNIYNYFYKYINHSINS